MTILYKYYSCGGGKAALKSQNLGFRKPEFFNDPFELTALSNSVGPVGKQETLNARIDQLKDQVAILCLTRSAFNPLMWAHYADQHQGFVIGYDVSGPFLNSPEYNLITVDSGDVLYTNTKTPFALNPESMEALNGVFQHAMGFEGRGHLAGRTALGDETGEAFTVRYDELAGSAPDRIDAGSSLTGIDRTV